MMFNFLNKPYPYDDDLKYNAKLILFISTCILAFLLVFRPIELSSYSSKEFTELGIGFSLSTFLILTFNLIVLPSFFPMVFNNNKWNIKREIFWNAWNIVATIGCYFVFYTVIFGVIEIRAYDVVKIILIGFFPVVLLIVVNYNRLLRSHLKTAQQINLKLSERKSLKEKMVFFVSEYKKDNLILKADSIIMIKAADNYIEVYYRSDGKVKKQMIRSSLKNAEQLLQNYDFIVKSHRSFILNVNYIVEVQGDSQGYRLFLKGIDAPVMVSPNYIDMIKSKI